MSTITAQPVDLTEHVFRSVRGWLHAMPELAELDIQIMRGNTNTEPGAVARPAIRLELAAGPSYEEASQGMRWLTMSLVVHYAAVQGHDSLWDAERKAGLIVARAAPPWGRIPMRLYNFAWPQPPELLEVAPAGGTLPTTIFVAVAAVGAGASASAPSVPLGIVVPAGAVVGVRPRNWPSGRPLAVDWEVYAGPTAAEVTRQGFVEPEGTYELAALVAGPAHPSNRNLEFSGLRVTSVDTAMVESPAADAVFDAAVTIRLRAQVPRVTDAQMASSLD